VTLFTTSDLDPADFAYDRFAEAIAAVR